MSGNQAVAAAAQRSIYDCAQRCDETARPESPTRIAVAFSRAAGARRMGVFWSRDCPATEPPMRVGAAGAWPAAPTEIVT
jgi:hypothetical protein